MSRWVSVAALLVTSLGLIYLGAPRLVPSIPSRLNSNKRLQELIVDISSQESELPEISSELWPELLEEIPLLSPEDRRHHTYALDLRFRSDYTAMYKIRGVENVALIYRQVCNEGPLVDYLILDYLSPTGVVPQVYGVSKSVVASSLVDEEVPLGKVKYLKTCESNETPIIRFTVMQLLKGKSLADSILEDGSIPLRHSVHIMEELIRVVEKMHTHNVIHGDLRWDNIIVSERSPGQKSVHLIDFEHASIFNLAELDGRCGESEEPLNVHTWNTAWEVQGCSKSFRDDMFQVLIAFGAMLYGRQYIYSQFLLTQLLPDETMSQRDERWLKFKTNPDSMFNFEHGDYTFRVQNTLGRRADGKLALALNGHLNRLTSMVMDMQIEDRPNYDGMVQVLQNIISELRLPM